MFGEKFYLSDNREELQLEIQTGREAGDVDGGVCFDSNGWQVNCGHFGNGGKGHVDTDIGSADIQNGEDWKKNWITFLN